MKIRFVQLESQAFLTDLDFVTMTAAERGVYCTIILHLYCNGGKCRLDPPALGRLCNCENFEKTWERIAKKSQTRKGVIRHKRVTKELRRAKKFAQDKRRAGLASAAKRNTVPTPLERRSSTGATKETKGNVIEKSSKAFTNTSSDEQALSSSNSLRPAAPAGQIRSLHFYDALVGIIRPRTRSDRTCFRRVANWLAASCAEGRFTDEIHSRVVDYAREAQTGTNPAAVFMALMKKELGYRSERTKYC